MSSFVDSHGGRPAPVKRCEENATVPHYSDPNNRPEALHIWMEPPKKKHHHQGWPCVSSGVLLQSAEGRQSQVKQQGTAGSRVKSSCVSLPARSKTVLNAFVQPVPAPSIGDDGGSDDDRDLSVIMHYHIRQASSCESLKLNSDSIVLA